MARVDQVEPYVNQTKENDIKQITNQHEQVRSLICSAVVRYLAQLSAIHCKRQLRFYVVLDSTLTMDYIVMLATSHTAYYIIDVGMLHLCAQCLNHVYTFNFTS